MKPQFFLLFAGLLILAVSIVPLNALDRDPGDRMTLPETTEFARKFNKFMEPVSFGVGSEPGFEKNSVYLYLMYNYAPDWSWMVKFNMDNTVDDKDDLDIADLDGADIGFEINRRRNFKLSVLPAVRHFKNMDLGFGIQGQYLYYRVRGLMSDGQNTEYMDFERTGFLVGPMIYLHWEFPVAKHIDFGGTTELSPIMWLRLNDDFEYTMNIYGIKEKNKDSSTDYGFQAPSINQNLYLTFIKFINLSANIEYDFFWSKMHGTQISHDTTLRFGLALLKKPKSGFLNFLVGVFYENEWIFMDWDNEHTYDHEHRWIFCIGASG